MEPVALVTMLVIAGFVWGGFLVLLTTALRKESRKQSDVENAPPAA